MSYYNNAQFASKILIFIWILNTYLTTREQTTTQIVFVCLCPDRVVTQFERHEV